MTFCRCSTMAVFTAALVVPISIGAAEKTLPGAPFLTLPLSVRQIGMGDVSLGGNDIMRAWTNPALLAGQDRQWELGFTGASLFGGLERGIGMGAGWRFAPEWVAGFFVSDYSVVFNEVDESGNELSGNTGRRTTAAAFTLATRLWNNCLGFTAKRIADGGVGGGTESLSAFAFDAGWFASWKDYFLGAAARNIGGKLRGADSATPEGVSLPAEGRVAFSRRFVQWNVLVGLEYVDTGSADTGGINSGVDWWPVDSFGLRAGAAGLGKAENTRITGGVSALVGSMELDYSLVTHALGLTQWMSVSFMLGSYGTQRTGLERRAVVRAPRMD